MKFILCLIYVAHVIQAKPCLCSGSPAIQNPVTQTHAPVGKRGLAYNDAALAKTFQKSCLKCTWGYNWDWSDNGLSNDIEFVPMLWNESRASQLHDNLKVLRERGLKYILGFNEPDHVTQANMPVERAVESHIQYLNEYSEVALIGSPAVTSDEAGSDPENHPKSLDWLRQFLDLCVEKGCKIDFCAVHWYGKASEAEQMIDFLHRAHLACPGKPLWLTEFHATGTTEEVSSFLKKVLPILDGLSFIQRYAWFMVAIDNLLQSSASLSGYGDVYASQ